VSDLGVEVHDAAVPPGLHSGQHRAAEQHRALDEEVQLSEVVGPGHFGHRGFGLRAGGVEYQHTDRAETVSDITDQPGNLVLIGDIGAKALSGAAIVTDAAADGSNLLVAGPAIDRDGNAVTGQAPRDHRPQAPRAARHQGDTPVRHCHLAIIPLRSALQRDSSAGRSIRDGRHQRSVRHRRAARRMVLMEGVTSRTVIAERTDSPVRPADIDREGQSAATTERSEQMPPPVPDRRIGALG
jgi:hypothetical protein